MMIRGMRKARPDKTKLANRTSETPTLTIVPLAVRQSDQIASEMAKAKHLKKRVAARQGPRPR